MTRQYEDGNHLTEEKKTKLKAVVKSVLPESAVDMIKVNNRRLRSTGKKGIILSEY